ncbi:MAG: polysaccharide biosynthesis/export family protein [Bryobacteraceae bacterium]
MLVCLVVASLAPIGAAKDKKNGKNDSKQVSPPAAPAPAGANEQPAAEPPQESPVDTAKFPATQAYIIGPEDVLELHIWRETELSGTLNVRPDGRVSIRLIGEVQAAGRTPEELAKVIRDGLSVKYLKDPIVTLTVRQVNSKKYYVQGEVGKPGVFPLLVPTTVFEAISVCGGFREFAKKNKIVVVRKGKRIPFNYKEVEKGKKLEQNIYLENGDTIIIP